MSGHGFHVHGPHDHELEYAAQGQGGEHTHSIAMFTAIVAMIGALFGYMGGATMSNSGLDKNNAAIKKTEASNPWGYDLARAWNQHSDEQMHQHPRWAQATTVLQAAIALAAIALLSRKRWTEWTQYAAGVIGLRVGAAAFPHV